MSKPIDVLTFGRIACELALRGFGDDLDWSESVKPPEMAAEFAFEVAFVICNSGMKNTVARRIYEKVAAELAADRSAHGAFGHKGKASAIDFVWTNRSKLFADYRAAVDKVAFCETLPWIGGITKYHLAKNFGVDVAKPDVHLQRLADHAGESVQGLCDRLAAASGLKSRTVDVVLWRACAEGLIDSKSGELRL